MGTGGPFLVLQLEPQGAWLATVCNVVSQAADELQLFFYFVEKETQDFL